MVLFVYRLPLNLGTNASCLSVRQNDQKFWNFVTKKFVDLVDFSAWVIFRFAGNVNVETETNQIDRAVAHLLFHRPLKLPVRLSETPESSTSTKVSTEQETATPSSLSVDLLGKSSEYEYDLTPLGPKSPRIFVDSHEEDTSNDVSQKVMRAYPRMKQMTAEHAD